MKIFSLSLIKIMLLSFFVLSAAVVTVAPVSQAFATGNTDSDNDGDNDTGGSSNVKGTANNNELVNTMCRVLNIVTGNAGKAFAAFAIISVGIGFFTGKVSWGLMIGVAAGIAAMFGAPTIVSAISGGTTFDCSSVN